MITTPRNKNAIVRVPKDDLIDAIPQAAKKPQLEARWVNENGKLICQWFYSENKEGYGVFSNSSFRYRSL
jgi:hypothetical protein